MMLRRSSPFLSLLVLAGCTTQPTKETKSPAQPKPKAMRAAEPGCGGPTYPCSMRQTAAALTVIPLPPLPDMGGLVGANTCVTVQPYNTEVCRCTDVKTDSTNTKLFSWEVTDTGGGNTVQWNSNQRLLRVVAMATGGTRVVGFDPDTKQCTPANLASGAPAGGAWSQHDPNVDYYQQNMTVVKKRVFDYTQPLKPPVVSTLFDFADCPFIKGMKVSYNTQIETNDDDVFMMAFGNDGDGQNEAHYIAAYRLSKGVCALFDTLTGQVQMSGVIPDVINIGQVQPFYPFTIHAADLTPGGQYNIGVGSTCTGCPKHGPFFWYPATTRLDQITTVVGGHAASGVKVYVNVTNPPRIASRPLADLTKTTAINTANFTFPTPANIHMGWQNNSGDDTAPICMSEMSTKQPIPLKITVPLENEIFCVNPVNGEYIRLSPTFSSGQPNKLNFRTIYAILANGPQGYIAFSSDWMGALGNTDGKTIQCKLGCDAPDAPRSDIFIVIPH